MSVKEELRQRRIERLADTVTQITWHIFMCDGELVNLNRENANIVYCSCQPLEKTGESCCVHIDAVRLVKELED